MTVAAVAYEHLTPSARQRVAVLLKLNPEYASWVVDVPEEDKDRVAFMKASLWADDIKRDPRYQTDGTHNGNVPSGPTSSINLGYSDKQKHKYWHFIDLPFSPDETTLIPPPVPNAKTQIPLFRQTLRSPTATDEVKSYDLVWLLHLVADVHQPLHATSRFNRRQPAGDDGGNEVTVCWTPCTNKRKLHAFWDNILGESKNPAVAIAKAKEMPLPDVELAVISDESSWIEESFHMAQEHVYASPIGIGPGPYELNEPYVAAAQDLAFHRIALAGVRLANLLNEAFQ